MALANQKAGALEMLLHGHPLKKKAKITILPLLKIGKKTPYLAHACGSLEIP